MKLMLSGFPILLQGGAQLVVVPETFVTKLEEETFGPLVQEESEQISGW